MTKNDAYKYARQMYKWAWHNKRGPYMQGLSGVRAAMFSQGYTESDYQMVRLWLKAWQAGRRYP